MFRRILAPLGALFVVLAASSAPAQFTPPNAGTISGDCTKASGSTTTVCTKTNGVALGDAATKNTGTTTGTLAAGDDSRITGAAQKAANLGDLPSASAARANLGLAPIAASGSASDLTSGTTPCARRPALTGDVTAPSGSCATTLANLPALNGSALTGLNASALATGTVPAARLPAPTSGTLGGVNAKAVATHQFVTGVATDGSISAAQPAATDVSGLAPSATTDTTNAANIASGTLPAARLPSPTSGTLGGVSSATAPPHQFGTGVSTAGAPTFAQPAAADVSGLAASATTDTTNAANIASGTLPAARLPAPTAGTLGGVSSAAAPSHQFGTGVSTAGAPTFAQPAASDLSGLAASATTDTTNAANISSGVLAASRGGAGAVTGALKANGSGLVTQAACADLSNAGTACPAATGTAGHVLPYLDGANTVSGAQTFTAAPKVNLNSASAPASITGAGVTVAAADGVVGRVEVKSFGTIGAFTASRYDGTAASPTAVQAGDQVGGFNGHAFDGTNLLGPIASFRVYATDTVTAAHWGSKACVATSATNTTTMADSFCQWQSGGVTVGSPTGGDKGAGSFNAASLYLNGSALTGIATASTSSAVASALSDETGTGALVFGTAPAITLTATGGTTAQSLNDALGTVLTPEMFGAKHDFAKVSDAAMTAASAVVTSASNPWAAGDVGKQICVADAGTGSGTYAVPYLPVCGTISAYTSAGQVTMSVAATRTVSGKLADWATDDGPAIQAAFDKVKTMTAGATVAFGPYYYWTNQNHLLWTNTRARGAGIGATQIVSRLGASTCATDAGQQYCVRLTIPGGASHVTIEGFTINNYLNYSQSNGLGCQFNASTLTFCSDYTVQDNEILFRPRPDLSTQGYMLWCQGGQHGRIRGNILDGGSTDASVASTQEGIELYGCVDTDVGGNTVRRVGNNPVWVTQDTLTGPTISANFHHNYVENSRYCYNVAPGGTVQPNAQRIVFDTNVCVNPFMYDFMIAAGSTTVLDDIRWINNTGIGGQRCFFLNGSTGAVSRKLVLIGNTCEGQTDASAGAIFANYLQNLSLIGNKVRTAAGEGYMFDTVTNLTGSANDAIDIQKSAVFVDNSTGVNWAGGQLLNYNIANSSDTGVFVRGSSWSLFNGQTCKGNTSASETYCGYVSSSSSDHITFANTQLLYTPGFGSPVYNQGTNPNVGLLNPTLSVTQGGTGATSATGTAGSVVLSNGPTIASPVLTSPTADQVVITGSLSKPGWGTSGVRFSEPAGTVTDTTSSGTVPTMYVHSFLSQTVNANSATTYSFVSGWDVECPIAGTNVTFTSQLWCFRSGGPIWIGGQIYGNQDLLLARGITLDNASGNYAITWSGHGIITSPGAGKIQLGAADAGLATAQFLKVQSVASGTGNTAGQTFTIQGAAGTGTAAGGSIKLQVAPAGSSGATPNSFVDAVTISGADKSVTIAGALIASGTAPTLTGTCTTATQLGGQTAGSFVTSAGCSATTVILTFGTTAPSGWVCVAQDETTPADAMKQTAHSATSCTLTGTTAAADVIVFEARAY